MIPLPLGEGNSDCARARRESRRASFRNRFRRERRTILPLPAGEGREGERVGCLGSLPIHALSALLSLLCLAALLAGCGKKPQRTTVDLPVYFTCDTRGRLEPCGCFAGQFGGLTRLKTVLDAEGKTNSLRVDVGDAIGGREDFDRIEYRYLLRAFAAMHYDALNIGHREAQLTAAQLREIKTNSPVPILSANLCDKASGKPIFDAWRIVERGGYRIAVVGMLDPRGIVDLGEGLVVDEMESTLTRVIGEVRARADFIVLLAFTDEATLTRLAQQFYEVPIILGGKVSQPSQELKRENRSVIYFVTNEGRALGYLRFRLTEGVAPKVMEDEIQFLHDKIPQDASFRALAQEYRNDVRKTRLDVDDPAKTSADVIPGVRTAASYVGSSRCVECHASAAEVWKKSSHSHAFSSLVDRGADADPKCVGCHVAGFGTATGYRREFGKAKLVDVGCESCHGPGSLHVRMVEGETGIDFKFRPLGAGDCQKCHHGEFSRPFHWNEFWRPIQHGKEPTKTASNR